MATCCPHGIYRCGRMYHRSARQSSQSAPSNHHWNLHAAHQPFAEAGLSVSVVAPQSAGGSGASRSECMQAEALPCSELAILGHHYPPPSLSFAF